MLREDAKMRHRHDWASFNPHLIGAGALGAFALLLLMRSSRHLKPAARLAMTEFYGLKEWLMTQVESFSADMEDAAAEAKHASALEKGVESILESLLNDEELRRKIQDILARNAGSERADQ